MLSHLTIKNIALIDHLELDIEKGLTILTGETGAGKSIILDALSLVLGKRADSTLIRSGTEKATVTATFQLPPDHSIQAWLKDRDLDSEEGELTIRRVIGTNTPSRAYVNEITVPLTTLSELGGQLVEIHGQHDYQVLLNSQTHLAILDAFAAHPSLLEQVNRYHDEWRQAHTRLAELKQKMRDALERRDYLVFQLEELEQAGVAPGELEQLDLQRTRLAHVNQLVQAGQSALAFLNGNPSEELTAGAASLLGRAASELEGVESLDATLQPLAESMRSLHYELDDVSERIQQYLENIEIDPAQLNEIEERVDLIRRLSRKHHCQADELEALTQQWREELETIDHADERIQVLESTREQARQAYEKEARSLTLSREHAAAKLTKATEKQLAALHMVNTRLSITLTPRSGDPRANGRDEVVFLVSPNPGEPPKPLKQIASGGELSRIMLALKTVLADLIQTTTLIFDEVDVGVGGRVAASIGEKLTQVAQGRQVLAITHLPQVAAWGENHLKVEKKSHAGKTQARILSLSGEDRVEELARMLAGDQVTGPARQNARDLLQTAEKNQTPSP